MVWKGGWTLVVDVKTESMDTLYDGATRILTAALGAFWSAHISPDRIERDASHAKATTLAE